MASGETCAIFGLLRRECNKGRFARKQSFALCSASVSDRHFPNIQSHPRDRCVLSALGKRQKVPTLWGSRFPVFELLRSILQAALLMLAMPFCPPFRMPLSAGCTDGGTSRKVTGRDDTCTVTGTAGHIAFYMPLGIAMPSFGHGASGGPVSGNNTRTRCMRLAAGYVTVFPRPVAFSMANFARTMPSRGSQRRGPARDITICPGAMRLDLVRRPAPGISGIGKLGLAAGYIAI